MTDPRKRAADLFRRACDGSSPHESEASLRAMVALVRKHNLVHAVGAAIENGMPTGSSDLSALGTALAAEEQRQHDIHLARVGATNAMAIACNLAWTIRQEGVADALFRVVAKAAEMPIDSITDANPDINKVEKPLRELIAAIQTHPVEARMNKVANAIRDLFRTDPVQPGADAIARKLGLRAVDVRAELKRLIESGDIEAVGKGRARRHMRVDHRPE